MFIISNNLRKKAEILIKNHKGVALLMTMLIMASFLVVVLMAADIITSGITMAKTQTFSTRAFFAAEAGAERALWEVRKNNFAFERADATPCVAPSDYIEFITNAPAVCNAALQEYILSNNAKYSVIYYTSGSLTTFQSIGDFSDTRRVVEVSF